MNGEEKPVAWRVKDYADGWTVYQYEHEAHRAARNGNLIEPLYTRAPINRPSPEAGESGLVDKPSSYDLALAWNDDLRAQLREATDTIERLQAELAEARKERDEARSAEAMGNDAMHAVREVCRNIMGGNLTFIDDDAARAIYTVKEELDRTRFFAAVAMGALVEAKRDRAVSLYYVAMLTSSMPSRSGVEDLHKYALRYVADLNAIATQAEAQRDALAGALEPFGATGAVLSAGPKDDTVWAGQTPAPPITFGHLRKAAQALASLSPAKDEEKGQ